MALLALLVIVKVLTTRWLLFDQALLSADFSLDYMRILKKNPEKI